MVEFGKFLAGLQERSSFPIDRVGIKFVKYFLATSSHLSPVPCSPFLWPVSLKTAAGPDADCWREFVGPYTPLGNPLAVSVGKVELGHRCREPCLNALR